MASFLRRTSMVFKIAFAIFLIYFAFRLFHYHYSLLAYPYPSALREGAMMINTDALLHGLNPYDISLQPRYMNQYGIMFPLIACPWAKVFGNTMLVHRTIIAFFIWASCSLVFLVNRRLEIPPLLNMWAVLMFYASLTYPGTSTPSIDPGSTGMFFMLLTVFIPWACRYSYPSLIISILIGLVAFYTKMYAFLGTLVILSFLFIFVSKRKALFYGALLSVLTVLSIILANHLLPAYFDNTFFASANQAPTWSSMDRLHQQISSYSHLHQWALILIGLFILGLGIKKLRMRPWTLKEMPLLLESIRQSDITLILYAAICSIFVLYFSLGRHLGATLWYFFQLLSPYFLIATVWLFSRISWWPIVCVPFLILNLHTITADHDYKLFDNSVPGWPQIETLITQHQHILNSPIIAPLLIEQHKEVFDDGQSEFSIAGGQRNYWMKGIFKVDTRILSQQLLFFQNIDYIVQNKGFDLIILEPSLLPFISADVEKYYKYEGQIMLYAPQDKKPYAVTAWKPL